MRAQYANLNDSGAGNAGNFSMTAGHRVTLSTPTPGAPAISEAHASFTGGAVPTSASLVQQGYGKIVEITIQ